MCSFVLVIDYFDYYNIPVILEMRRCELFNFALFQDSFKYSGSLAFSYEFWDYHLDFHKKA